MRNAKEAWDNIKILQKGFNGHHMECRAIKFRDENGKIQTSDKESIRIAGNHFTKVFNHNAKVDMEHVLRTKPKEMIFSIADLITFKEFNNALNKLS